MLWHIVISGLSCLALTGLFIREAHMHRKARERVESLESQLNAARADQTRLYREKMDLNLKLRTAQQSYVFDLPTHIPGSHCCCQN